MPNESKTRKPTRRADNEGSIYQRADGLWCAQVTVGYHPETGRPMRKTFYGKTKAEALGKKESTLAALQRGIRMTTGHIQTLEEFVREWMGRYKRPKVTPRTYEWYCTIAEKHIYPALGSLPLRNVTEDSVQDLLNQRILDEGYSLKLVKAVRGLLSQALSRAVKQGLIPYNPAAEAELPPLGTRSRAGREGSHPRRSAPPNAGSRRAGRNHEADPPHAAVYRHSRRGTSGAGMEEHRL